VPRSCTVCEHPDAVAINEALVLERQSNRAITRQYGLSKDAVRRHREHIPQLLVKAYEAEEIADADRLKAELDRCFERVNLLFDACDRWLRDPADPTRYDIGPRAHELRVTYEDESGRRHKATLAELLSRASDAGETGRGVTMVETKHADPRDLLLKTAGRLHNQLELLARLLGELNEGTTVNIVSNPQWLELRTIIVQALDPHPAAREDVVRAIEGKAGASGANGSG
jgi:hypothetical protein